MSATTSVVSPDLERGLFDALRHLDVVAFTSTPSTEISQTELAWLLDGFECASVVAIWLDLADATNDALHMELGLAAATGKLVIGCPKASPARPAVEIVARRFNAHLAGDLRGFAAAIEDRFISTRERT